MTVISGWQKGEKFLLKDKYLAPVIKKHGSCTIRKRQKSKYFVSLVREIVNQQLHGKAAEAIFGRVKEKVNGKVTPESITRLRISQLRSCGLSNAKSAYVKDLAKKVKNGEVQPSSLDKLDDEKVVDELTKVKGIGRWTAEMFLMFALARPDVFPVGDLGIRKGMEKLLEKELNQDQMIEFSLRWRPHRTVASWYLWRVLE